MKDKKCTANSIISVKQAAYSSETFRYFAVLFLVAHTISPGSIFSISPVHSEIKFQVTHPFKTVNGTCEKIEIKNFRAQISNGRLQSMNPFSITLTVDGMTTGNGNRDSNMYRVLDFPRIKIIEAVIQNITYSDQNHYRINGILRIKGKENPFETEGVLLKEEDSYIMQGRMSMLLSDYGVDRPVLFMAIDNKVMIDFRIKLK